jgi:hypothetical protein
MFGKGMVNSRKPPIQRGTQGKGLVRVQTALKYLTPDTIYHETLKCSFEDAEPAELHHGYGFKSSVSELDKYKLPTTKGRLFVHCCKFTLSLTGFARLPEFVRNAKCPHIQGVR